MRLIITERGQKFRHELFRDEVNSSIERVIPDMKEY